MLNHVVVSYHQQFTLHTHSQLLRHFYFFGINLFNVTLCILRPEINSMARSLENFLCR